MTIVCATDFSQPASEALAVAAEIARKRGERLLIWHSVQPQMGDPLDPYLEPVLAEGLCLLLLAFAQAFTGGNHEHNGDDPPRDAEHSQKCAQLVRPEGAEDVADEIAQDHEGGFGPPVWRATRKSLGLDARSRRR